MALIHIGFANASCWRKADIRYGTDVGKESKKTDALLSRGTRGRPSALGSTMPGAATLHAAPDQGSLSLFGRNRVHGPALALAHEREALVADNMDSSAFTAWKIAEFIQELGRGETLLPTRWQEKRFLSRATSRGV